MIKVGISCLVLLWGGLISAQEIHWISIEEAQELSEQAPRPVMVDVYTDWCGYCKKMDASTFHDSSVVSYVNEHYYAVKLNAESHKSCKYAGLQLTEEELAAYWKVHGFPTIMLLDPSEDFMRRKPGYFTVDGMMYLLESFDHRYHRKHKN